MSVECGSHLRADLIVVFQQRLQLFPNACTQAHLRGQRTFIPELGLKLERVKGAIEVFVIDHAAKPSPN